MNFDSRTLLFSLILTNALMVLCLLVVVYGRDDINKRDGMGKWAGAIFLGSLVWIIAALRGTFPDAISIVFAHGFYALSQALMLAAIYEFQQRSAPRWQCYVPVLLMLLMAGLLVDDIRSRYFWSSLILIVQLLFIARALLSDKASRDGRAWRLMLGGVLLMMVVMMLRAIAALFGHAAFAQVNNAVVLQPVQLLAFVVIMAATLIGTVSFILMVKERSDREIMLLAMTDSLTQVPNRRALMEHAEQALARRSGTPLALLMIDVDYFKRINDTHGHPAGDAVLCNVAQRLLGRLRGHDLLGRYGGEEFCVVAPETDGPGAWVFAESLRETIAATPFRAANSALSITVSIGISLCQPDQMRELKDVLAEADSALYSAKQSGRNKVVCHALAPSAMS